MDTFISHDGYQIEPKAKKILKGLAFKDEDFHRPAREMSGGWVMRAHMAQLLVAEPDLLMLAVMLAVALMLCFTACGSKEAATTETKTIVTTTHDSVTSHKIPVQAPHSVPVPF